MSASSRTELDFSMDGMAPRAWFRLDGGITRDFFHADEDSMDEELADAFNELTPGTDYEVFRLHRYDGGSLREKPSEVVVKSVSEDDYTMYAYKLDEPVMTTDVNMRVDDRRDHLPVNVQIMQGQDHGYAHRSNASDDTRISLGEMKGFEGDVLRGRDGKDWSLEQATGAWTSKMDPTLIDWYRDAPRGLDLMESAHTVSDEGFVLERDGLTQVASYLDNFRDTIDVVVNRYESEPEAWEDVRERNYEALAGKLDGISAQGLENMLEELPDMMDRYTEHVLQ